MALKLKRTEAIVRWEPAVAPFAPGTGPTPNAAAPARSPSGEGSGRVASSSCAAPPRLGLCGCSRDCSPAAETHVQANDFLGKETEGRPLTSSVGDGASHMLSVLAEPV